MCWPQPERRRYVRLLRGGERPADAKQTHVGPLGDDSRQHVEQRVDALARDRAADVQQLRAGQLAGQRRRRACVGRGVRHGRARRVHANRHDRHPIGSTPGRGAPARPAWPRCRTRPARPRCSPRSTRADEHARQARLALVRQEQRPERVGVVTGHHDTAAQAGRWPGARSCDRRCGRRRRRASRRSHRG